MTPERRLRVMSHGGGVQTVTLGFLAAHGEIKPIDAAIFSDTTKERRKTYEYLDWYEAEIQRCPHPFPIYRVSRGDLREAALRVRRTRDGQRTYIATAIPVYTLEGVKRGMGLRQCTRDFKVAMVRAKARELVAAHLRIERPRTKDGALVELLMGISIDEADRMRDSPRQWIRHSYPLIELGMARGDCALWLERKGYPLPPRSSCVFCGFHSDDEWLALEPEEFSEAVEMDNELRVAYAQASSIKAVPYLHESRVPLSQVKFRPRGGKDSERQLNMFRNDCQGMCGV